MIHYDSLLQNARDIITKCNRSLLQNASGFLLQNATVYYKIQQLLQNTTFVTNYNSTHTNEEGLRQLAFNFFDAIRHKKFEKRIYYIYYKWDEIVSLLYLL